MKTHSWCCLRSGNDGHFNRAAQLHLQRQANYRQSDSQVLTNNNLNLWECHPTRSLPLCHSGSDLHAVQCSARAAHTAGPEAALLRQGPVAQGQQLTAQPQVLPAQTRLKATLGVLSEQLAASADVLSSELWEGRRAVSIVPAETQAEGRQRLYIRIYGERRERREILKTCHNTRFKHVEQRWENFKTAEATRRAGEAADGQSL